MSNSIRVKPLLAALYFTSLPLSIEHFLLRPKSKLSLEVCWLILVQVDEEGRSLGLDEAVENNCFLLLILVIIKFILSCYIRLTPILQVTCVGGYLSKIKRGVASVPIHTMAFWLNCVPSTFDISRLIPRARKLSSVVHCSDGSVLIPSKTWWVCCFNVSCKCSLLIKFSFRSFCWLEWVKRGDKNRALVA